ncbi:TetR/AcrR family transcriptional regulator [Streptomyces inhibens]|uniref:TetR/AcrR family transcriptional regulator n=1 Tax=Streptomyces inhibens TaxID=2293571 RepID=UPI001EE6E72B|nr:TetR/AcrR family transcriptional regulator [Streptomyces inhibens]UKY53470.1 TetR/AcrR family transcriptional regulator [Streptomyces inhibens]
MGGQRWRGAGPGGGRGRPARYCSRSCQAKAYRRRRQTPAPAAERPAATGTRMRKRRQIAEALWRIAAERGLHAASLREVAAEAGVSLRTVQYHFESKHQLLVAALHMLHEENERIARSRIDHDPADPRALLRAVLEEFLPVDDQRATALRVFAAYYARSLTDPALAEVFLSGDQPLERLVADLIAAAQAGGRTAPGLDPWREADLLVSGTVGLGGDVLHQRRTLEDVRRTLDYHLDKIFAGDRGAQP